jgi:signal peptidase I
MGKKDKSGNSTQKEQENKPIEMPTAELLEKELARETYKNSYGKIIRSTVFSLIVVAAAAVLIAMLVFPVLQISGTSMTDTLYDGDIVVAVNDSNYKVGDIIAFYYNNNILVKRVIATSGDWVDIDDDGNVYVNGSLLEEDYLTGKAFGECNIKLPYQVPDNRCFVMGDHRATSIDSRNTAVGCISDDAVVGKLKFRIWPLSRIGSVNNL